MAKAGKLKLEFEESKEQTKKEEMEDENFPEEVDLEFSATSTDINVQKIEEAAKSQTQEETSGNAEVSPIRPSQPSGPEEHKTLTNTKISDKFSEAAEQDHFEDEQSAAKSGTKTDTRISTLMTSKTFANLDKALQAEIKAEIKISVTKQKYELVSEFKSDSKLLEYKVNQILKRLNFKNPSIQKQILFIRKLLALHSKKKY